MAEEELHRQRIALAAVTAGMRLAADVTDSQGRCLVPAGTVIGERLAEQLARHGVDSVEVEVPLSDEERRVARDEVLQRLERRFGDVGDDPLMAELYRLVRDYQLGKL